MKHLHRIVSEFMVIASNGVDLSSQPTDDSAGDPLQDRFKSFYDAAYGSWTYPDPYTQQVIMDAPNKLFALDPER